MHPLSSLDIICHEIGHALTSWLFGGLVYRHQSGGINEAYSDIVGRLVVTFLLKPFLSCDNSIEI